MDGRHGWHEHAPRTLCVCISLDKNFVYAYHQTLYIAQLNMHVDDTFLLYMGSQNKNVWLFAFRQGENSELGSPWPNWLSPKLDASNLMGSRPSSGGIAEMNFSRISCIQFNRHKGAFTSKYTNNCLVEFSAKNTMTTTLSWAINL